MKQHLGRQSGVQKVEVSLLDGKVDITPKDDGQIDPGQLLKATYDSGVTVAEMDVTASGRVIRDAGGLALQVAPNRRYLIEQNEFSEKLQPLADSQEAVTVRGQLYKKTNGKKKWDASVPLKLLVLEIKKKE